jgi:hypothetical protein
MAGSSGSAPDAWTGGPSAGVMDGPPSADSGESAPGRSRRRLPWRRFTAIGLTLIAFGLFAGGFAAGWSSRAGIGGPAGTDSDVDVVAAPTGVGTIDVALPDVRGLAVVDAQQAMADAGLSPDVIAVENTPSAQPAGTVVRQDPIGGTADAGRVTLFVSVSGQVPDLVGQSADRADQTLTDLGVRVQHKQVYDPAIAEGTVTALDPPAGSPLPLLVTVTIAGPASSMFLSELDALEGGCSSGPAAINGTTYQDSLSCSASSSGSDERVTTYLLDRLTSSVEGVAGIDDGSDPGLTVDVRLIGDGRVLFTGTLRYGEATTFTADTRGVLRLEIGYRTTSEDESGSFALGDARAVGAPADITTLGTK